MPERVRSRRAAESELQPLLYTREQVCRLLGGVSTATVIRLEREGLLTPLRLSRSPTAMVFFRAAEVRALVEDATHG